MANEFIARLTVDSKEYDSRLKNAVSGMQHLERATRDAGKSMNDLTEEQVEYIRSMGQMETKATSAKGKLAELTKSYTEMSMQYRRMTEEEKRGDGGRALAQSIDQLKGRIKDFKGELKDVNLELGEGSGLSGVLDAVAGKIGIPVEMFTKLGAAAAGIGAALKVSTDALKQNEEFMDEWGATVESAKGLYDGFLNALNTGDFSGFFRSMDDIVLAARAAYDAMDELGTFNAFNQIQKEAAKTNFTQAVADFREGKISKEDAQAAADALKAELQTQADKERKVYEKTVKKLAKTRNVNGERLFELLSTGDYSDYEAIKAMMPSKAVTEYQGRMDNMGNMTYTPVTTMTYADEMEELGGMLRLLGDDQLAAIQALGAQAQRTATEIAQIDRQVVRLLGTGGKGGIVKPEEVLPAGSIAEVKARIAELNKAYEMAGDASTRDRIRIQIEDLKRELEMMSTPLTGLGQVVPLSVELLDTSKEKLAADMEELRKRLGLEPIKLGVKVGTDGKGTVETAKQTEKAWGAAANAISAIGGALQQIEDPSAKVAGIIMQAVANIALGFATATTQAAAGGPFAWIAATVAGIANMISAVTAIKQVTSSGKGFANGGIVPGNSFSGDNLHTSDYGINSGELILNRAQQNTIASQLQGGASKIRVEGIVSGPNILLAGSNYALQTGKAVKGLNGYALPIIAG